MNSVNLPPDVFDWVRTVFGDCNARVTAKLSRNPNAPEESFQPSEPSAVELSGLSAVLNCPPRLHPLVAAEAGHLHRDGATTAKRGLGGLLVAHPE
jgi:hypothetical protein